LEKLIKFCRDVFNKYEVKIVLLKFFKYSIDDPKKYLIEEMDHEKEDLKSENLFRRFGKKQMSK
jgi:hypothetical protein